jgi:hypothetical protein
MIRFVLLLLLSSAASAHADVFLYARAKRSAEEIPARYTGPLPPLLDPDPSHASWQQRLDQIPDGPTHLGQRLCRDGASERDRLLAAMRRAAGDQEFPDEKLRFLLNLYLRCRAEADRASLCDWMRHVIPIEANGMARRLLYEQFLLCATPDDAALFTAAGAPDMTVVSFLKKHPAAGYSNRLEAAVRAQARAEEWKKLGYAVAVYGQRDDPRVAATLLELYAAANDPEGRRVLGLALHGQTNPRASEVYSAEWKSDCEHWRAIRAENRRGEQASRIRRLGYQDESLPDCDVSRRHQGPYTPPSRLSRLTKGGRARDRPISHFERLRNALAEYGLAERFMGISAYDAGPLGSHAPRMRRMADLVRPELDALVIEEVWPSLDEFVFERGPLEAWVKVDAGYRVKVGERAGEPDPDQIEAIKKDLESALAAPHFVDAWMDGQRFRFRIRGLGPFYDVEALVGAMNTLLRARDSELRFVVLEAFDGVDIVVGPAATIRAAIDAGAITAGDPFAAARMIPEFRRHLLEVGEQ